MRHTVYQMLAIITVGCVVCLDRSAEGLCQRDLHSTLGILQRSEHHGAERDGSRRDPSGDRRPHSRESA